MGTLIAADSYGQIDVRLHLRRTRIFARLSELQLYDVGCLCRMRKYPKGSEIYRIWEAADELFLLIGGSVKISYGVIPRPITIADGNEFYPMFGWASLLHEGSHRIASSVCLTHSNTLVMSSAKLRRLMESDNDIGFNIMRQVTSLILDDFNALAAG